MSQINSRTSNHEAKNTQLKPEIRDFGTALWAAGDRPAIHEVRDLLDTHAAVPTLECIYPPPPVINSAIPCHTWGPAGMYVGSGRVQEGGSRKQEQCNTFQPPPSPHPREGVWTPHRGTTPYVCWRGHAIYIIQSRCDSEPRGPFHRQAGLAWLRLLLLPCPSYFGSRRITQIALFIRSRHPCLNIHTHTSNTTTDATSP